MDGFGQGEYGNFEDQFRRMIINNGTEQASPDNVTQQFQPTVRLPPRASHNAAQQQPAPQVWSGGNAGYAQNPTFVQPATQNGSPAARQQAVPPHRRKEYQQQMQQQGRGGPQGFHHSPHGFANRPHPHQNNSPNQRARQQQQVPIDPNAFNRGNFTPPHIRSNSGQQQLYNPNQPRGPPRASFADQHFRQAQHLEQIAASEIGSVEMTAAERDEKESFHTALDHICREVCETDPERLPKVSLECFGSFKSGFATAGSDMDLVIVVRDNSSASVCFSLLEDDLPRALEKRLLQLGYGARLLSRTRVPIIKVCEKPSGSFLDKLKEERERWDLLPNEKKYPHLHPEKDEADEVGEAEVLDSGAKDQPIQSDEPKSQEVTGGSNQTLNGVVKEQTEINGEASATLHVKNVQSNDTTQTPIVTDHTLNASDQQNKKRSEDEKPWTRERKAGPLDFPKTGVGIQSDINFFNPLGIHNTQLLRCYSLCDPRVRPMVLFVKAWAKRRKINSSYSGTLSSYGYVLMVLHYLVNVAQPPVLPNLQLQWRPRAFQTSSIEDKVEIDGWNVTFWRDEDEIIASAQNGLLTANQEPLGSLLAGFFHYFSSLGGPPQFRWMQEVLSLRSAGGILTKEDKGWVKAVTEEGEGKRVQHRYLFCIEDPFELNHNVARTVTHKGIVAIRDEFRRAKRILQAIGNGLFPKEGELFAQLIETEDFQKATAELKASGDAVNGTADGVADTVASASPATQNKGHNQQAHTSNQQKHDKPPNSPAVTSSPHHRKQKSLGGNRNTSTTPSKTSALNFNDSEAFPALGGSKQSKKKSPSYRDAPQEDYSEISGDKAKAYLEEVKRKKDEAQAESTATGAAEAVLGDSD